MRLAKLCITLAFGLGGWHGALASALCARHDDCRAPAAARAPHAPQSHSHTAGRETPGHAPDNHDQTATHAAAAPANDHGHCGSRAESADGHAAPSGARKQTTRGGANVSPESDRNASPESDGDASPETDGHVSSETDANVSPASGNDGDVSPGRVADPRAPASSCAHCVGRQTTQPASVNSVAPVFARDSHAAGAPTQQLVTPQTPRPRTRLGPAEHSPPRGRPLHLLNSALLI